MAVPTVTKGRSAWTKVGKDNGTVRYAYVANMPLDGSKPTKDVNYQAVHLAVKAIQARCNELLATNLPFPLTVDGKYGTETANRVKQVQVMYKLLEDGQVGSITSRYLWRPLINLNGKKFVFDPKYLWGQVMTESSFDAGAVGYLNPPDSGLVQINLASHPDITAEQAYEPHFALDYGAKRFSGALKKFASKPDRQVNAAILQHNSPLNASKYWNTGLYPTLQSKQYVDTVLKNAATY